MVQRILSLILALLFAYVFTRTGETYGDKFLYLGGLLTLTAIINAIFHARALARNSDITFLLLPLFFIFAAAAFTASVSTGLYRTIIAAICAILFFALEIRLKPRLTNLIFFDNLFLLSTFGIFLGIWATDFFLTPGWWAIVGLLFVVSLSLLWYGLYPSPVPNYEKLIYSLISAFVLAQIGWALLFWPLHYFTMAIVFTSFFYLAWELIRFHVRGSLTRQKVVFHFSVVGILLAVALYTANWIP